MTGLTLDQANRIFETAMRCQSGIANRVDAELCATLSDDAPEWAENRLIHAGLAIADGDLPQAKKHLDSISYLGDLSE